MNHFYIVIYTKYFQENIFYYKNRDINVLFIIVY